MIRTSKITIGLIDDHVLFREGFRDLLSDQKDFQIVAEASDGRAAIHVVSEQDPDVVLMDLRLPVMGGVSAIRQIRATNSRVKIVVVSMHEDEEHKEAAFVAGADAYHSKMDNVDAIVRTIRALMSGKRLVDPAYVERLREKASESDEGDMPILTPKEHQILEELGKGRPNKQVADLLAISERTVKNHLNAIFKKMGVKSRLEAVRKAMDKKWISLV